ncbi:MAG: prevent-host-death protein [Comamonadaceae bacterium]|nr:prevent-host-death protein [Comamonadaceae bacterium]
MKTAVLPSVRVEPELRAELEAVLSDGESLSAFVEQAVRDAAKRRRTQAEFIARGLAGREAARRTGVYFTIDDVDRKLGALLAEARARVTAAK